MHAVRACAVTEPEQQPAPTRPTSSTRSCVRMLCVCGAHGSNSLLCGTVAPCMPQAVVDRGAATTTATLHPPLHSGPRSRSSSTGPAATCRWLQAGGGEGVWCRH